MRIDIKIKKTLHSPHRQFHLDVQMSSNHQRIVIMGPSGSGKSLTLKAIAGLMPLENGHIYLGDTILFDATAGINLKPQARKIGFLFQDYALFPHLNVRQNIGFALHRGWLNPRFQENHPLVDHWLDAFHLREFAHQFPRELSGGQKQRTALARALVCEPKALLLDEPFAALDPHLRGRMREELDRLQQQLTIPMILITHDPEDARIFGDHVIQLQEGAVVS